MRPSDAYAIVFAPPPEIHRRAGFRTLSSRLRIGLPIAFLNRKTPPMTYRTIGPGRDRYSTPASGTRSYSAIPVRVGRTLSLLKKTDK